MSDLVTRLLAEIDRREAKARERGTNPNERWTEEELARYADELRLLKAHRKIVGHWQAAKDALNATEGTILAGACKVRLGAYDNVILALAEGYGLTTEEGE